MVVGHGSHYGAAHGACHRVRGGVWRIVMRGAMHEQMFKGQERVGAVQDTWGPGERDASHAWCVQKSKAVRRVRVVHR